MARVLVTGASGFIGRHLCADLLRHGHEVSGTFLAPSELKGFEPDIELSRLDVRHRPSVERIVRKRRPEIVYHLAGQAYVLQSYRDPVGTFETNAIGTIHLFEALRTCFPLRSVVVACTGAAYGYPDHNPIEEECRLVPNHPYGVSKAAQDMICYQYARNFDMPIVRARLFGTTGPGKRGDAINDFAIQLRTLQLSTSRRRVLQVGNLRTFRDISDVRDTIRALQLLARVGAPGEAVNIGAGRAFGIGSLLRRLIRLYNVDVKVHESPALLRPTDETRVVADVGRLRTHGFQPKFPMDRTLADVVAYWTAAIRPGSPAP